MCIRDRYWRIVFDPVPEGAIAPNIFLQQKDSVDVGEPIDCLLYTSDAADERSSVDLGGRRIIKKKNTVIHSVLRVISTKQDRNIHSR